MTAGRIGLVVNQGGGSSDDASLAEVVAVLEEAGVDFELRRPDGDPTDDARGLVAGGVTALVVGGGDGTVGSVAAVAAEAGLPLGVLPLGTMNNFAKDLGLPGEPADAARVVTAGRTRTVDLGLLGDLVFVNNVSVGAYAHLVDHREQLEDRVGKLRGGIAAVRAVFPYRPVPIELTVDGESIATDATIVLFGNNDYVVDAGRFTRESLDAGVISVYVLRAPRVWDVLRIAFRIARDRIGNERDLVHRVGRRITLSTPRSKVMIAHDGEVVEVATPLEICSRARALEVFVPVDDGSSSA